MNLSERRAARMLALQALYELDSTTHLIEQVIPERIDSMETPATDEQRTFIYTLVNGTRTSQHSVDQVIQQYATERPFDQLAIIDRNIIRMAIFEFMIGGQTPVSAAINEAVELAKTFGAESAPRFVNGVLGAVAEHEIEVRAQLEEQS